MAIQKKPTTVPPEVIADARRRAAQARQKIEDERRRSQLLTPQEKADAAPFYFVLRNYIRQLKLAREAAGLTLAQVSERSGIAIESLSRLETGATTNPTWKTLGSYASAVGCTPQLLVESASTGSVPDFNVRSSTAPSSVPVYPARIRPRTMGTKSSSSNNWANASIAEIPNMTIAN